MKKRALALLLVISIILPIISATGLISFANEKKDAEIISVPEKELKLWYDEEAPYGNESISIAYKGANEYKDIADDGWEKWSLPLGNGYSGINVFGRTETERIQITDNTLSSQLNKIQTVNGTDYFAGGLNNFSETYLDFGHVHANVTNYTRALDLRTAVSTVNYTYNGVNYSREYFTSYPDKAIVIRLAASGENNLSFTLRPTIPYEQDYMVKEGDGFSKHGTVVASNDGTITLSGNLGYNDVDFAAKYKIVNSGGTVTASNGTNEDGAIDNGTLTVNGATSAYVIITLSTNYELSSDIFTTTSAKDKLNNSTINALATAEAELTAASSYTYAQLRERHIADYDNLFGRVEVDFGGAVPSVTTDVLLNNYIAGNEDVYLDELYFQFGRYLLIASSREGSLPANLQGTWNRYNLASWGSGYWHNINVQMNYWPAFSTNLAETFTSYIDFFDAFLPQAQKYATDIISGEKYKTNLGKDGGNGWTIGVGSQAMHISTAAGAGNVGFTTQMMWDYYDFTRDMNILSETVYPALKGASQYITKIFAEEPDGTYLSIWGDSPEQWVDGVWYYTKGTTYDQSFAHVNGYYTLLAAELLGIKATDEGESILATLEKQLPYYDPIVVGYSGQVKEFREEDYYGDLGEYAHRHISQLVGLYPGNLINSTTPAWIDAAKYTLSQREMGTAGDAWGWSIAHRQSLWARVGDGEEAYKQYQKLLKMRTSTNLWSKTPAGFQIDGNFGGTAGVSEMLLQSQSGYIEPLAAIPSSWATGSYSGLVARGNFEVSAKWENGNAKVFNITSNAGGLCQIKHGGLANAVVLTSDGKTVNHTQVSSDIISFNTEVGETYIICNISEVERVEAPAGLTAIATGKNSYALDWEKSEDAVSYNVYKAVENDSNYTYVGTTNSTNCLYTTSSAEENKRMTYRVCAVNKNGVESDGVLAYVNPIETDIVSVTVCETGGKLQFAIDTDGTYADLFRVYEKLSDGTYKLVAESKFSVISLEEYDIKKQYAISTVCGHFESAKINASPKSQNSFGKYSENVLLLKPVTYEGLAIWGPSYHPDKVTDGITSANRATIHDGRFSSTYSDSVTPSIFTIDLNGVYELDKFTIDNYDSVYRYTDVTIEVLYNGVWTNAAAKTLSSAIRSDVYDLNGAKAEKIRITLVDKKNAQAITIQEFTCSGKLIGESFETSSNVFAGKHVTVESIYPWTISDHQADKITDGITTTRRSTESGSVANPAKYGRFALSDKANNGATLVVELNGLYKLNTLTFDRVNTTSLSYVKIELYRNGAWNTVIEDGKDVTNAHIANAVYNLNGALAEKVRINVQNNVSTAGVAIQEVICSGQRVSDSGSYHNVLQKAESFDYEGTAINSSFPPERITNDLKIYGVSNGWHTWKDAVFSTVSTTNPSVTITYNFDAVYSLETLNIEGYANGYVDTVKIEAYHNGVWTTVLNKTYSSTKYFYEGLGGALASKVRLTLANTSQPTVNVYEVSISGSKVSEFDRVSTVDALGTLLEKAKVSGDSGYISAINNLVALVNRTIADSSYDETKVNTAFERVNEFASLGMGNILPSDVMFNYTFGADDNVPSSTMSNLEAKNDAGASNYKPSAQDMSSIQIRNQQNSYSIVNENGNYVFKRGNGTAKNTGYINFFANCDGFQPSHVANYENAGRSFVFEFDIKAVDVPSEINLVQFISRAASSTIFAPILKLSADGNIYASKDSTKATIVNVKSSDYTNIAVFVDVSANRYYVYVNGVNATPNGFEFLTSSQWNSIAGTYTAGTENVTLRAGEFIFGEARVLQDNNTTAEVYMDNFTAYYAYEKTQETDVATYPVELYDKGGYVGAYTDLNGAYDKIKQNTAGTYTIVIRRDMTKSANTHISNFTGSLTIDLSGHNVTVNSTGKYFLDLGTATGGIKNTFVIKNGTLTKAGGNGLICINYTTNFKDTDAEYTFVFDKVTFKATNESVKNVIFNTWEDGFSSGAAALVKVVSTFNNCTFDLANSTAGSVMLPLNYMNNNRDRVVHNVTINGGIIIANTAEDFAARFYKSDALTEGRFDTLTFSNLEGEKYTSLVLDSSATAPTVACNDGALVFVKISENSDSVTYRLQPIEIASLSFSPKTSITLGSELVYNVYVPVKDYLKSFTVDGKTYANAKIVTLDDGNQYYHIAVPMAASEAAKSIVLKASVTIGGKDYNGTWTMSITKYAKSVIESGTAEEVTLVKDVLAYIKAAYVYFDADDKDEAITAIDEILGTYERAFEKVLGETNTEEGLKSVSIILDEKPIVRFVLPEGKTAENYTFKIGNKTLEYTTGTVTVDGKDHAYVELKLYAYQLIGEIAYTDGTYSGSFHINSYYDFVTTDEAYKNNTALITLVEKLYNYCKSAEAYRASVTNE